MGEAGRQYRWVLAVILLPVLLSGCAVLRRADDKAGELFKEFGIETELPETGTSSRFKLPDIDPVAALRSALKLKDRFFPDNSTSTEPAATSTFDKEKLETAVTDAKDLSREAKDAIDTWLADNGFNRFGDPIGTYYAGGTPLFNELTGEAIDRFEYILKKRPEIFRIINN